jgi:hypothetical protein
VLRRPLEHLVGHLRRQLGEAFDKAAVDETDRRRRQVGRSEGAPAARSRSATASEDL